MKYLIDTCVIAELIKAKPHDAVIQWLKRQHESHLYISVLTLGEIFKGIEKVKNENRKKKLQLWVQHELIERFKGRILTVDQQVAMVWGEIQGKAEKKGRGMPTIDGLIAATGLAFNMVVVTRNTKDMEESGAALLNPWDENHLVNR